MFRKEYKQKTHFLLPSKQQSLVSHNCRSKMRFIILELIPVYTLVSEVHECIKVILIDQLSSSPVSSVDRASDFKSQDCAFESHYGQDFIFLYFVAFDVLLASPVVTYTWNQAWRTSEVYRCIERVNIWKNIVAAFRGMHVSPAKHSYAWLPRKCDYIYTGNTLFSWIS